MSDDTSPRPERDGGSVLPDLPAFRPLGQEVANPDRACIGCLIGVGLIVLSVAIWIFIYVRFNPELTPRPPVAPHRTKNQP
jgi:hypothetical protein